MCGAADVQPATHQARADQVSAAGEAYVGAVQRDQDVQDGLAVLGTDNRKLREDLTQLVPRALAGGMIPEALVPLVRARWQRIESEMENMRKYVKAVAKSGNAPMPGPAEKVVGGHCVLIVGYDDSSQRFLCMNSWSTKWGQKGFFTIPYAYLTDSDLASDFWTVRVV